MLAPWVVNAILPSSINIVATLRKQALSGMSLCVNFFLSYPNNICSLRNKWKQGGKKYHQWLYLSEATILQFDVYKLYF
jgi:hypothetical protein